MPKLIVFGKLQNVKFKEILDKTKLFYTTDPREII
jgi:hypothetical protein